MRINQRFVMEIGTAHDLLMYWYGMHGMRHTSGRARDFSKNHLVADIFLR